MNAEPLPEDLRRDFEAAVLKASLDIQSARFEDAIGTLTELYELLLTRQPPGTRYHKGLPLHNIGYCLVRLGRQEEAARHFFLAYIEDLLSQELGEEDAADSAPASQTLRLAYRVKAELLDRLKDLARTRKRADREPSDPEELLAEFAAPRSSAEVLQEIPEAQPAASGGRKPGQFTSEWHRRVFVGGGYREFAILNEIKRLVQEKDFDAILVADFDILEGMTHHHSLMLLHECRAAIFDLSSEAGQLMEIERLRDYEIEKTLLIYQDRGKGEPKISEMLKALLTRMNMPPCPYRDFDELRRLVRAFLDGL